MQETTDKSLLADTYEQATIRIQETKKALDEAILNSYHAQEAAKTRDVILYHLSELRERAEWAYQITLEADDDIRRATNAHHGAMQEWCKAKQNNEGLQEI